MKIGLNGTCFNERPSGAKQRFLGIYSQLFYLMPNDMFVIYEPSDCRVSEWFDAPNVKSIKTPIPSEGRLKKYIFGINFWKSSLLKENFDIFESFNQPIIKSPKGRTIQTIHDIRSLSVSKSKLINLLSKYTHTRSIQKADQVLTVSSSMREEILDFFPNAKVSYIYNGINRKIFQNLSCDDLDKVKKDFHLPQRFILSVGHFEQRKNYINLVKSIKLLKDNGKNYNLVIIGNDNGEKKNLEKLIQKYNLSSNIYLFSGLSDLEVISMYSLCSLFAFASKYEGFGIPVLEAMAAKKPMILSNLPVFKEITQNQASFFDPESVNSIASSIDEAMKNIEIFKEFNSNHENRISDFDFYNLAQQMKDLYYSLI